MEKEGRVKKRRKKKPEALSQSLVFHLILADATFSSDMAVHYYSVLRMAIAPDCYGTWVRPFDLR